MDGLTIHAPMTDMLRKRGAFDRAPFVLIDAGCSGGIDEAWRAFGSSLVAHAYDPDVAACEELQARERFENVHYHARHVGLPETHPFARQRREAATRWPNTNIWGRVTAGYLAARGQPTAPAAPPQIADPSAVIGVDDIVQTEDLPTVDFLKIDVDGPDVEVLESARDILTTSRVLGVGMEVNWFGSVDPTEHTFHNTDRFLREQGFTLFGVTVRRYSRTDLPAPFEKEAFAYTQFGQPYQGDGIYVRDLAADHLAAVAADYPPEKLIKLACIYELIGVPDCAAEVLNRFKHQLKEFGDRESLLDALTPPLLAERLSYREYIAEFQRKPELFLPSAAPASQASPRNFIAPSPAAPGVAQTVKRRLRRHWASLKSLRGRRVTPAALAARTRSDFLERAPSGVVHRVAAGLGRVRPLALEPGWHFRVPGDGEGQFTLLKRDIWAHYQQNGIDQPIVFRWYDGLRLRLYLGNDLSLCLYVLGSFEPNEFVFLRSLLEPGMVVLDGGANEGLFSLYAARRVGSHGVVLAVEPSTREFRRMETNFTLNRLDNVKTFNVALGNRVGEATLAVAKPANAGLNAIEAGDPGEPAAAWTESREPVSVETIDELVGRSAVQRLDLIKLDIEGAEVDALEGARATIGRFHPMILLEAEEARLGGQGRTKADLRAVLDEFGYELWVFDGGSAQLRRAEVPSEPEGNAVAATRGWLPPVLG